MGGVETGTSNSATTESWQLSACEAALALAGKEREKAVKALKGLARNAKAAVRKRAAECLTEIGGEAAVIGLIGLLKDHNPEIRQVAVAALGVLRVRSSRGLIEDMLKSERNAEVRIMAARALGRMNNRSGLSLVVEMLDSKNERHRRLAVVALGDIIGQKFSPNQDGIKAARRYLRTQAHKWFDGDAQ